MYGSCSFGTANTNKNNNYDYNNIKEISLIKINEGIINEVMSVMGEQTQFEIKI